MAGLFGLVGKFHPFLGEHAPRNLADLIHRRVCASPALLCGKAAACRKVLRVVDRAHWAVSALVPLVSELPRSLAFARVAARYLRCCARIFSRLASR
jgi:hypothetical protein